MPLSFVQTVLLWAVTASSVAETAPSGPALQPSTIEDWRGANMDGTGCFWSERKGGPVLLAAAGDIALTRLDGAVVMLSPAQDAVDLYPFTHDRWQSDQLTIRIVASAEIEEIGKEAIATAADLIVINDGGVSRLPGFMICGS